MRMITEEHYNTIQEFTGLLLHCHIPFSVTYSFDGGAKWTFPFTDGDFICNCAVFGPSYVESMAMPWDEDDVTTCTLQQAISNLRKYFKEDIKKYQPII